MSKKLNYLAALTLSSFASFSMAESYVGASVGLSDVGLADFDKGTSFALFGGYAINESLAIELAYIDFGGAEDDVSPIWTVDSTGFNFAVVGTIPVAEKVDLFAKFGLLMWDSSIKQAGGISIEDKDGIDISYGFGASFDVTKEVALHLELQRFDIANEDVLNLSFGAKYIF